MGHVPEFFTLAFNRGSFYFRVKANKKLKYIIYFSPLRTVIKLMFSPNNSPKMK